MKKGSFITTWISVVLMILTFLTEIIIENHMGDGYIHDHMIWIQDILNVLMSVSLLSFIVWLVYDNDNLI